MLSRDYLYAQPVRIKSIEAIRIALVKYGALKPSDKRRFLTPKEAQKLKAKWRSCKNIREFIALSKLRPPHALKLELFIGIHQKQKSNITLEECMSVGIAWPSLFAIVPSEVDKLVVVFVELSKVADDPCSGPDCDQCDVYLFTLRGFWPGDKQRIQPIERRGRLDAWVDE